MLTAKVKIHLDKLHFLKGLCQGIVKGLSFF